MPWDASWARQEGTNRKDLAWKDFMVRAVGWGSAQWTDRIVRNALRASASFLLTHRGRSIVCGETWTFDVDQTLPP